MSVRPHRLRVTRKGAVKLRLACPRRTGTCTARVRLRLAGHTVAGSHVTIRAGHARTVKLVLGRRAQRRLRRAGSLHLTVVVSARNADGARSTTRTPVRLLPPRRH